jgi:hypothetical protein
MNAKILKVSMLLAAGAAVGLGGCQSASRTQGEPGTEFSSGLAALLKDRTGPSVDASSIEDLLADRSDTSDLESMIQSSYETLERAFMDAETVPEPIVVAAEPAAAQPVLVEPAAEEDVLASLPANYDALGAGLAALVAESGGEEAIPEAEDADPATAIRSASRELADAILAQMPYSMTPADDALALLGLESLVPGVSEAAIAGGTLSDEEQAYVESLLRFMDAVRALELDPDAPVDTAQQVAMDLAQSRPIRIVQAQLCTRVEGYGQYTRFPTNRFVAGRGQRVIVYVEVDRIGHETVSPASGETTPRFAVELTQKIEVYHSSDDVLALATPTLKDRRVGRNRFRDYYVVTAVDLPATLSVGEYKIKVTIRDASDDGVSQAVIPLTIVADSSALNIGTP